MKRTHLYRIVAAVAVLAVILGALLPALSSF
jgi:hypothetical protein